jgi:hypothetical protein
MYASRKLDLIQQRWSDTKQEFYSLVWNKEVLTISTWKLYCEREDNRVKSLPKYERNNK